MQAECEGLARSREVGHQKLMSLVERVRTPMEQVSIIYTRLQVIELLQFIFMLQTINHHTSGAHQ